MDLDKVFKAYDIRGKAKTELTAELAFSVGRALADFLPEGPVAVGRDMRPDSGTLADNLMKGLLKQGREVIDIGLVTTDMAYFAVGKYKLAGGAVVTASHNPSGYNGIKLLGESAVPLGQNSGLDKIKQALIQDRFKATETQQNVTSKDCRPDYIEHLLTFVDTADWQGLKVVLDAGNGMAGQVLASLADQLPIETIPLFWELDGNFPNRPSNPLPPQNLAKLAEAVTNNQANAGAAYDGDADRVFLVDEKGQQLSAALSAAIIASTVLKLHPAATLVCDVRMSKLLDTAVKKMGGKLVRVAVGSPNIVAAMKQHNSPFAVEGSGHFYFKDLWYGSSGLLASLVAIDVLVHAKLPLSKLAAGYQTYAQSGEINIESSNQEAVLAKLHQHFKNGKVSHLDGLSVEYPDWWFNIRPSNTEPLLRLNVEADNKEVLDQKLEEISELIESA